MAEVLLFHHAHGLTEGCLSFAAELRDGGHVVHTPDLYDGKTFAQFDDGVAYAQEIGLDTLVARGRVVAEGVPGADVFAGMSLGVMPAQMLAQTTPRTRGCVLLHGTVRPGDLGREWPAGVPLQMHTMDADAWGDAEVAREVAEAVAGAELFLYPGDKHLFTDAGLPDYDESAAGLVMQRVLAFLDAL
jgi:dienelactone hydrolase